MISILTSQCQEDNSGPEEVLERMDCEDLGSTSRGDAQHDTIPKRMRTEARQADHMVTSNTPQLNLEVLKSAEKVPTQSEHPAQHNTRGSWTLPPGRIDGVAARMALSEKTALRMEAENRYLEDRGLQTDDLPRADAVWKSSAAEPICHALRALRQGAWWGGSVLADLRTTTSCIYTQGRLVNGTVKVHHVENHDYHTSLMPFMAGLRNQLLSLAQAREINRCLLLHLAIGNGEHPFPLLCAYRELAQRVLAEDNELPKS